MQQLVRLRRLRMSKGIRNMVRETVIAANDFVYSLFVISSNKQKQQKLLYRVCFTIRLIWQQKLLKKLLLPGITAVLLFGLPDMKDACWG